METSAHAAAALGPLNTHGDGLDAFAAEPSSVSGRGDRKPLRARPWIVGALIAAIAAGLGVAGAVAYQKWLARASRSASLTIETVPSGLEVTIDGTSRGRTPVTLTLPPRDYEAIVGTGNDRRVVKTSLSPGAAVVQRLEWTAPSAAVPAAGAILRVDTIPSALPIKIDGTARGVSPLTIENLAPGDHDVSFANGSEATHRKITVRDGETLSLLLTAAPASQPTVSAGWISIESPVSLQIREDGKLLGSTESERLLMPSGNHRLDVANEELGFSQRLAVSVTPGKVSVLRVAVPNGSLSINAQPWAEVWVDGARVGETPIGNLVRPIGPHEIVFRHPDLGERRETVMVTALQPARLGVDLRRKTQ